jgi:hypothetical protein
LNIRYYYPILIQCSTPLAYIKTLYLNIFRGEPAISEHVKHITPTHRSSHSFAAEKGSGFHPDFIGASPCPWVARSVSGPPTATNLALLRLAFAMIPVQNTLI